MNENTKNELINLAKEFNLKKLILFGSAMESIEDANDIDLACSGISGRNFLKFGIKLEELFQKSVDLVFIDNSRFAMEIAKNGVLIYESETN